MDFAQEDIIRLGVSLLIGGLIGAEREYHGKVRWVTNHDHDLRWVSPVYDDIGPYWRLRRPDCGQYCKWYRFSGSGHHFSGREPGKRPDYRRNGMGRIGVGHVRRGRTVRYCADWFRLYSGVATVAGPVCQADSDN